MEPEFCYGLLFNYDVRKKGWPDEVDPQMRNDRYCIVSFTTSPNTVWRLPDSCPARLKNPEPRFCNPSPYNVATPYSAFATFWCQDSGDSFDLHSWQGQCIAPCFRHCCEALKTRFIRDGATLKATLKQEVEKAGKRWDGIRQNFTRPNNAALQALAAIDKSELRRVYTVDTFADASKGTNYENLGWQWADFIITHESIPYYPSKVSDNRLVLVRPCLLYTSPSPRDS